MYGIDTLQNVDESIRLELGSTSMYSGVSDIFGRLINASIKGCGCHPLWYWENRKNIAS